MPRTEAEAILGKRFVKDALRLSPPIVTARVVQLSLTLEKAIERAGFTSFIAQDQAKFNATTAAGPSLLTEVLKTAIADGKTDLAAVPASAFGRSDRPERPFCHRPAPSSGRCVFTSGPTAPIRGGQGYCDAGAHRGLSRSRPSCSDAGQVPAETVPTACHRD